MKPSPVASTNGKEKTINAILDPWLDVTGFVAKGTSYHGELLGLLRDAFDAGKRETLTSSPQPNQGEEIKKAITKFEQDLDVYKTDFESKFDLPPSPDDSIDTFLYQSGRTLVAELRRHLGLNITIERESGNPLKEEE